jgi:hypothetical protein
MYALFEHERIVIELVSGSRLTVDELIDGDRAGLRRRVVGFVEGVDCATQAGERDAGVIHRRIVL